MSTTTSSPMPVQDSSKCQTWTVPNPDPGNTQDIQYAACGGMSSEMMPIWSSNQATKSMCLDTAYMYQPGDRIWIEPEEGKKATLDKNCIITKQGCENSHQWPYDSAGNPRKDPYFQVKYDTVASTMSVEEMRNTICSHCSFGGKQDFCKGEGGPLNTTDTSVLVERVQEVLKDKIPVPETKYHVWLENRCVSMRNIAMWHNWCIHPSTRAKPGDKEKTKEMYGVDGPAFEWVCGTPWEEGGYTGALKPATSISDATDLASQCCRITREYCEFHGQSYSPGTPGTDDAVCEDSPFEQLIGMVLGPFLTQTIFKYGFQVWNKMPPFMRAGLTTLMEAAFEGQILGVETLNAFSDLIMCRSGFGSCLGKFAEAIANNALLLEADIFKQGFIMLGDIASQIGAAFDAVAGALNSASKWLGSHMGPVLGPMLGGIFKAGSVASKAIADGAKAIGSGLKTAGKAIASAGHWISSHWSDAKLKHVIRMVKKDFVAPGIHLYEFKWNSIAEKEYGLSGRIYGVLTREIKKAGYPHLVTRDANGYEQVRTDLCLEEINPTLMSDNEYPSGIYMRLYLIVSEPYHCKPFLDKLFPPTPHKTTSRPSSSSSHTSKGGSKGDALCEKLDSPLSVDLHRKLCPGGNTVPPVQLSAVSACSTVYTSPPCNPVKKFPKQENPDDSESGWDKAKEMMKAIGEGLWESVTTPKGLAETSKMLAGMAVQKALFEKVMTEYMMKNQTEEQANQRLLDFLKKKGSKSAAKEGEESAGKRIANARKAAEEAFEDAEKKAGEEAGEEGAEGAADEGATVASEEASELATKEASEAAAKEATEVAVQTAEEAGEKAAAEMAAQIAEEEAEAMLAQATAEAASGPAGEIMLAFQLATMILSIWDPTGILMQLTPSSIRQMGAGQLKALPNSLAKQGMWPMYVSMMETVPPPYRDDFNEQIRSRSMWYSYHSERYKAHYSQWHECATQAVAKYKANELSINYKNEYDCYLKQKPSLNKILTTPAPGSTPAPPVIPPDPANDVMNRNIDAHHKVQKDQIGAIINNLDDAPMFSGGWGKPVAPTPAPTLSPTANPTSKGTSKGQDTIPQDQEDDVVVPKTPTPESGGGSTKLGIIIGAVVGVIIIVVVVVIAVVKKRKSANMEDTSVSSSFRMSNMNTEASTHPPALVSTTTV